jgi:LCP family protein required for cell wall assembly
VSRGYSAASPVPAAYGGGTPPGGRPPGPPPRSGGSSGSSEPRRRRVSGAVLATRIVAAVVAAIVLVGAGVAWGITGTLQSNSGTSDAAGNAGNAGVISEGGLTILLVGSDARTDADGNPLSAEELAQVATEDDGGGVNTDTIMLVHIPEGGGKATAVSLPRDTWMSKRVMNQVVGPYADGSEGAYNPNKINSYYATAKAYTEQRLVNEGVTDKAQIERESNEAGRTMLIRVVQAFSGMKIDHYAEVNLLGFYLLSNAIGGVPVCLNAATQDDFSGANFQAGPQDVQGTAALAFVRQRHGLPGGDLDRVRRQQAFLAGAAKKILSVGTLTNPSKLSDLIGAIDRSVIFDKDFSVLTFAQQITDLSAGNIIFETLPTTGSESSTDKDALATDPAQIKAFFGAISGGAAAAEAPATAAAVDPASITVDIQDGTVADGVTTFATQVVRNNGFELGQASVLSGTKSGNEQLTTEIHYPADAAGAAQQVAAAFGVGELVEDDAINSGHILVVVGTDLDVSGSAPAAGSAAAQAENSAAADAPAADSATDAPAAESLTASSVPCVN